MAPDLTVARQLPSEKTEQARFKTVRGRHWCRFCKFKHFQINDFNGNLGSMKFPRALQLSILGMIWTTGTRVAGHSVSGTRNLLVGAYSGNLTTLIFNPSKGTLERSSHTAESYMPSWQTLLASPSGKKYILSASRGEGRENSSISVWEVDKDGALKFKSQTAKDAVPAGPVSIAAREDGFIVAAS